MRRDQQIKVNEMLLEREELFLRIHTAEKEVLRIMGGDYPFTTVELPSNRRAKRKTVPARAATAPAPADASERATITLRRLEPGEARYRVTYRQFAQVVIEEHGDFDAVRTLLACQSSQLQVQKLETLRADGSVGANLD
jgi:hypothetical protein